MFGQLESTGAVMSQGRSNRAQVELNADVRQGDRPWRKVHLEDISQDGFRITWFPNCRPAEDIKVRIPGMQMLTAHVRWQEGNSIGCQFANPLYIAVFEHIAEQARLSN